MRRALISLALLGSGCSVVVDGLSPPPCENNSQCAVLNDIHGISTDGCELYQCSTRALCELQARDDDRDGRVAPGCEGVPLAEGLEVDCNDEVPSGTEVCNGIDDDCDAIIDERFVVDGVASSPLPAELPTSLVSVPGATAMGSVGYGAGLNALAMVYVASDETSFGLISGSTVTGPNAMRFMRAEDLTSTTDTTLVEGCHRRLMDGSFVLGDCSFDEIDLGVTDESVFATVIGLGGCSAGQVRVGYFPRGGAPDVIQRGPLSRSNAFFGIDVDRATDVTLPCTGGSRASGVRGAARPALAAMDVSGEEDQALTGWIADSFTRDACMGTEADVELLGLHVQQESFGGTYGWVTASNEGLPQVVGRTTQGGRPGIGVWPDTGYLVGFGAPGGGVSLVFVPKMVAPARYDRSRAADDRTGIETPPLEIVPLDTLATDGPADDVAIAFGSIQTGGIVAGVTWREGCGSGSETIRFREIFLARDGAGNVSIDDAQSFDPIDLTPSATSAAGPPAIVFQFSGMIEPMVPRLDGRPMANTTNDGGWIVAWSDASEPEAGPIDDTRILARRVSELDGRLLNEDELLVLNAPGDVARLRPALYVDGDDRVSHAFLAVGAENGFRGGALTCTPAE